MKMTLLEMVQNILSAMDSDEVNSYSDTTEARQVAEIIRTTYFNIIARANLPEHKSLFGLTPSLDEDLPVVMYAPSNVRKIEWIKYDTNEDDEPTEPHFTYVTVLPITQFLDHIHSFDLDATEVVSMTLNDHIYYYYNDRGPSYCTILEDNTIIFDAYDSALDTTLKEEKSLCYGQVVPTFTLEDTFTPDLDDYQFPLLLNEAKSLAFMELKQIAHEKAEQEARRQWRASQHNKYLHTFKSFDQLANFGRK